MTSAAKSGLFRFQWISKWRIAENLRVLFAGGPES
jgi:hypothetical protein